MKGKYIDLHVHTNYSDGFDSIEEVIQKAKENKVKILSLVEHYNISSYEKAKKIAGNDIEIIPGIEIGSDMSSYQSGKHHVCHLLAYFVDDSICELLDQYEIERYECVVHTLTQLKKQGIEITMEDVLDSARDRRSVGRFDIAITLHKLGYAKTPQEAYGRYLDHRNKNYVKRKKLDPFELTKKIIEYGGVPVLAHPKSLRLRGNSLQVFMRKMAKAGLCGIEVYNSNNGKDDKRLYMSFCKMYDLIPTVGSDYHGGNRKPEIEIGKGINNNLLIKDMSIIERLKSKKKEIDEKNNKTDSE